MKNASLLLRWRNLLGFLTLLVLIAATSILYAQPKYRTFNQFDFSQKKGKVGKALGSTACFTFHNDSTGITVNSLHARFNSEIVGIIDSGGFSSVVIGFKNKVVDFTGRTIAVGDSVTVCLKLAKKAPGSQANFWWWDTNGVQVGVRRAELAGDPVTIIRTEPNGGNVRDYLYKHVVQRPAGVVIGYPNPTTGGWIRYKTADRKYFPHTDSSRCFDYLINGEGNKHAFIGELKNPHVKKHNNHLLGEDHILRLAIMANDSGVTEPDTPATRLGDLIYNDLGNPSDPCNNMTVRDISKLIDSALTYCASFTSSFYFQLDSCVSRVNRAFDGPYHAISYSPFVLAGTNTLPPFLHPNPSIAPVTVHRQNISIIDEVPNQFAVYQNYPNPFNPTTKIDFTLPISSFVTVKVYNMLGQEVATLLNNEQLDEGEQSVELDASHLSSGVYFYRVSAQGQEAPQQIYQSVKRMVLIK